MWNAMVQNAVEGLKTLDPGMAARYMAAMEGVKVTDAMEDDGTLAALARGAAADGEILDDDEEIGPDGRRRVSLTYCLLPRRNSRQSSIAAERGETCGASRVFDVPCQV
jgi:hypothetical protein